MSPKSFILKYSYCLSMNYYHVEPIYELKARNVFVMTKEYLIKMKENRFLSGTNAKYNGKDF